MLSVSGSVFYAQGKKSGYVRDLAKLLSEFNTPRDRSPMDAREHLSVSLSVLLLAPPLKLD